MPRVSGLAAAALAVALAAALAAAYVLQQRPGGAASAEPAAVEASQAGGGEVYLVVLGTVACPHCRAMLGFLPGLGVPVYFCEVYGNKTCMDTLALLARLGVADGVPVVAACSGDRLLFIEVGELRDHGWWLGMLRQPPPRPLVYRGGRPAAALDGQVYGLVSRALCLHAKGAAEPVEGGG